ncbi:MAG: hypothetical protein WAU38_01010, partial [Ignavibacteria bacterium]
VEFWLAKLLARLAEQASRSGGLSKQENISQHRETKSQRVLISNYNSSASLLASLCGSLCV